MPTHALVTVLIPTHSHDETLLFSVRSVLEQTMEDFQVVVVGDGVTDEVRQVADALCRSDDRVIFEDHPKTPRHGETLRDRIIRSSTSRFVAYNCDDDLWFPDHLETLLGRVGHHDFIHPLPVLVEADGILSFPASDLSRPDSVRWHLEGTVPRNSISLSGVMHTRDAYLRLPHGWRETPAGRWTDHYMWEQFFRQEWFSGVTSASATTLKLRSQGREDLPLGARGAEIARWWDRMHSPGFAAEWEEMVRAAMWRAAVDHTVEAAHRADESVHLLEVVEELRDQLRETEAAADLLRLRVDSLRERLVLMRTSRSWRLTRPLRALRRPAR